MRGESEREDDPREEDRHEENLWRFAQTLRQDADKTNPQHHIHTGTTHLACQATTPNQDRETPNGGAVFARLLPDHEVESPSARCDWIILVVPESVVRATVFFNI